jgi:hypothetical protein
MASVPFHSRFICLLVTICWRLRRDILLVWSNLEPRRPHSKNVSFPNFTHSFPSVEPDKYLFTETDYVLE